MFVKISHSLTGSLIIFDCTLLAALSVHISVSLVWQMRPIVDFLFLHVTRVWDDTVGIENDWEEKREQWQSRANNLSVIKAAEWKRTLCTVIGAWREEGRCSETDHLHTKFLWHCTSWDGIGGDLQLHTINHNDQSNVKHELSRPLRNFTASREVIAVTAA